MKLKFLYTAAVASLMLTSCEMQLDPVGSLDQENALETVNDATSFRNYFYVVARSFTTSAFFSYSDIQCDMFNGTVINGNRMGTIANGSLVSSDSDVASYWAFFYSAIANINYFLEKAEPVYQAYLEAGDENSAARMARFIGEAHFFRGYYYATMLDRWCVYYDSSKGDQEGLGLPIVTVYDPTSDRSKYPGRSTMNETISFINNEFALALEALLNYEANPYSGGENTLVPMADYISSYAVLAMEARFNLWIGNYAQAQKLAQQVIDCGIYTICSRTDYEAMWVNDSSTEIIFMPFESTSELASSIGSAWISTATNAADYIPASTLMDDYKENGYLQLLGYSDVRATVFLGTRDLTVNSVNYTTTVFNKFPGNPALQTSGINLQNKPKVFRLSEMYLIVAECAAALNDAATANTALNTLLTNRIRGYKDQDLTGTALTEEIRFQRSLELVGEGFRLSDLRRWKMGFARANGADYSTAGIAGICNPTGLEVVYTTDDYRYTWPIPSDEITNNPQIRNQQNPGY